MHNLCTNSIRILFIFGLSIFEFSILLQNCNSEKKDYKFFDEIT